MGSYGSLGEAAPYIQAGSEGAIGASVGDAIDIVKDRMKKNYNEEDENDNNNQKEEGVYYYNGTKVDTRPHRPKNYK